MKTRYFKRISTAVFILAALAMPMNSYASDKEEPQGKKLFRHTYLNLGYEKSSITQSGITLDSYLAGSFTAGTTIYFHKKPLAEVVKLGLDLTFADISYMDYRIDHISKGETRQYDIKKIDYAAQIGPSVVIRPVGKMNIHLYGRFTPTIHLNLNNGISFLGFAPSVAFGGSLSYGPAGIGAEFRSGKCETENIIPIRDVEGNTMLKEDITRVYLTFRF